MTKSQKYGKINKIMLYIDQLKRRVQELEESISEYQTAPTVQSVSILLIMDTDESNGLGIDTLTYDNISKLSEVIDKYDEILVVINDIPFTIKRKIHKIAKDVCHRPHSGGLKIRNGKFDSPG